MIKTYLHLLFIGVFFSSLVVALAHEVQQEDLKSELFYDGESSSLLDKTSIPFIESIWKDQEEIQDMTHKLINQIVDPVLSDQILSRELTPTCPLHLEKKSEEELFRQLKPFTKSWNEPKKDPMEDEYGQITPLDLIEILSKIKQNQVSILSYLDMIKRVEKNCYIVKK